MSENDIQKIYDIIVRLYRRLTMNIYLLLLILLLSGISIGAGILSLIGWFFLIIFLVFCWEYKAFILGFLILYLAVIFTAKFIFNYLKYKDETPEEREERLKTNKMIDRWKKQNRF